MNHACLGLQRGRRGDLYPRSYLFEVKHVAFYLVSVMFLLGCPEKTPSTDVAPEAIQDVTAGQDGPRVFDEAPCEPQCQGRECGSDLCGGLCGSCEAGEICAVGGQCQPEEVACTETCEGRGFDCGEVCGEICGTCSGEQEQCEEGQCVCQPACDGRTCGDADGCGGFCTPCPVDINCVECAFQLEVVERTLQDGLLTHVTLALRFKPSEGVALPVMADIQLKVKGPASIERVGLGQALLDSGKTPLTHPHTGASYQRLDGETYRFVLLSTQNINTINGGHWLSLRFAIGDTAQDGPATFALVPHSQILAPMAANGLDYSEIENQIVIWPEVSND